MTQDDPATAPGTSPAAPSPSSSSPRIFVDADACPVKDEVLRVAVRHDVPVVIVGNAWIRGLDHPLVQKIVVGQEPDAADDWIAEKIGPGDVAVTRDIPLASRCLEKGAKVLDHGGKSFTDASIGMALAMRDLMTTLRDAGEVTGGPSSFSRQDRSKFLQALETTLQAVRRAPG